MPPSSRWKTRHRWDERLAAIGVAYLGLVPSEMSSGEKQRKGRITKAGNGRLRSLLVQAALSILRLRSPRTEVL